MVVGKDADMENIEIIATNEIRMNRGNSGEPLTMISCDIHKICRIVLDSIYDLDNGKGATPRDVSLQTGFSFELVMLVLEYEKHRIQSQWFSGEAVTRYKVIE